MSFFSNYARSFYAWQQVVSTSFSDLENKDFSHTDLSNPYLFPYEPNPALVHGKDEEDTPLLSIQANFVREGLLISVMAYQSVIDNQQLSEILRILFDCGSDPCKNHPQSPQFEMPKMEALLAQIVVCNGETPVPSVMRVS